MSRFTEPLKKFNDEWNDLPRRLLTILLLIGVLFLALYALPYVAPFVVAALFSWMLDPLIRFITKRLGSGRLARKIVSALLVLILASGLIILLMVLIGRMIREIASLAAILPDWVRSASSDALKWIDGLHIEWVPEDAGVQEALMRILSDLASMATSLATRMASTVARVAWQTAAFLPQGILFLVLTLAGTYYLSAEKAKIFSFLGTLLPEKYRKRSSEYRTGILLAVFSQFRVSLVVFFITFALLLAGFLLMGIDYAVLLALLLALADWLPILGIGLFLAPMFLYGLAIGDIVLTVVSAALYILIIIARQLVTSRMIGKQLGLHPLATMMSMYAGLVAMGVLGMLLGPVMLLLCKLALTVQTPETEMLAAPEAARKSLPKVSLSIRKKKKHP